MHILFIILLVIIAFIALLLIAALFVAKTYTLQKEITIDKPDQMVFDYVKLLKNQKYYNIWVMMDPNMVTQDKGVDGTEGFFSAWDSEHKDLGKGEQTIKKIINGKQMDLEIRFIKPFEGLAMATFIIEPISSTTTKLTWSFTTGMPYPKNLMLIISKKIIGNALETGLINLKKDIESK
jgi:Ca2+/Na+ antiporter